MGSCIGRTQCSKNIAFYFFEKRLSLSLLSRTDLTTSGLTKKMNSADEEYNNIIICDVNYNF